MRKGQMYINNCVLVPWRICPTIFCGTEVLNSEPWTYWASAVPLEPYCQAYLEVFGSQVGGEGRKEG
jgi:hypothetical protein